MRKALKWEPLKVHRRVCLNIKKFVKSLSSTDMSCFYKFRPEYRMKLIFFISKVHILGCFLLFNENADM